MNNWWKQVKLDLEEPLKETLKYRPGIADLGYLIIFPISSYFMWGFWMGFVSFIAIVLLMFFSLLDNNINKFKKEINKLSKEIEELVDSACNYFLTNESISAVLGLSVQKFSISDKGVLDIYHKEGNTKLSIHEFAHKAKEWSAIDEKYNYIIGHSGFDRYKGFCWIFIADERITDCAYIEKEFNAATETMAICLALEYFYNEVYKVHLKEME